MGRQLTELEKAKRAATRKVNKEREALGPLFADQAEKVDVRSLLVERRMGHARNVEHLAELLTPVLRDLTYQALRRRAVEIAGAEAIDKLENYHCPPEQMSDRLRCYLRDKHGVPYTMESSWWKCSKCRYYHAPGQTECVAWQLEKGEER
jgi:hypothetical protein